MFEIIISEPFEQWLKGLRDRCAAARVQVRLDRLALGNFGDAKAVGGGVSELRIDYGPGYRLYFMRSGQMVVVMLCGGDKASQKRDIESALALAKQWKA